MRFRRRQSHSILPSPSPIPPRREVGKSGASVGSADLESVLDICIRAAVQSTGANSAAIALMETGRLVCRARLGDMAPEIGVPLSVDTGITGAGVRTGQILNCYDAQTDERVDAEVCLKLGIRSILVMPILVNAAVVAVLVALSVNSWAFGPLHVQCLQKVADFVRKFCCRINMDAEPVALPEPLGRSETSEHARKHFGSKAGQRFLANEGQGQDSGLATIRGALEEIPLTSTWEDICQELVLQLEK